MLEPERLANPDEPASLLLHKPAGFTGNPASLARPASRWEGDSTRVVMLPRHLTRLTQVMPLEPAASGLVVLTQDGRLLRRMREDATRIECEFIVDTTGEIEPYGLPRLMHGLAYEGRNLPPCKVSWQNETRLRFAMKDARDGQLAYMCSQVGLQVLAIRRIRIGRVSMGKMPVNTWRYLPANEPL